MAFRVDRHRISGFFGIGALILSVGALGSVRVGNGALESVIVACRRMFFLFSEHLSLGTGVFIALLFLLMSGVVHACFGALRDFIAARTLERRARARARRLDGMPDVFLTEGMPYHAWTAGILRPRIYLSSEAFDRLSEGERAALLAHERAHVRHHDVLRRTMADVMKRFFWFMPTVGELVAHLRFGQEVRADREAMAAAGKRALCSLYLASASSSAKTPSFVSGFAFATPRLSEVLDGKPVKAELSAPRLAISLAMAALLLFGGWSGLVREARAGAPSTCEHIATMAPRSFTPILGPLELHTPIPENACNGNLSC